MPEMSANAPISLAAFTASDSAFSLPPPSSSSVPLPSPLKKWILILRP
jgi:hypothetical protein